MYIIINCDYIYSFNILCCIYNLAFVYLLLLIIIRISKFGLEFE
jgi:hypothetical protein